MDNSKQSPTSDYKIIPFVLSLPDNHIGYYEIVKPERSIDMRSGFVTLHFGEDVGSHTTGKREELLIVLEGVGEVQIENHESKKIQPRSVVYIPPNTCHNVFNMGENPLKYIYVVSGV
ncbi:MAG: cupin domain-containing protein [bacterium]